MSAARTRTLLSAGFIVTLMLAGSQQAEAQGRGKRTVEESAHPATVGLSVELRSEIASFYASSPRQDVSSLPPGIQKRLQRGKPLPPGLARRAVPPALEQRIAVPTGYELVEVGLDVLLVEIATNVVHDVLMDVIR